MVLTAKPGSEDAVSTALAELADQIRDLPGLIELTAGPNVHARSREAGVSHGLLVRLESEESLAAYRIHPAHQALMPKLDAGAAERLVLSWPVEEHTHVRRAGAVG